MSVETAQSARPDEPRLSIVGEGQRRRAKLTGRWTADQAPRIEDCVAKIIDSAEARGALTLDLAAVERLDTIGAWIIDRTVRHLRSRRRGSETVLSVRELEVGFEDRTVLHGLDLDLYRGEILGVVGASGAGKSVLLRTVLGLLPKRSGTIELLGQNLDEITPEDRRALELRLGVLFQFGALFSSLTVAENIQLNLREHLQLSERLLEEVTLLKLDMVGLAPETAEKLPSELSGGMVKRAALARALGFDPEILLLDEPTSGLDPIGAGEFDELIATLRDSLGLTVFMVTHDLDSLYAICDRITAIGNGRVIVAGDIETMLRLDDPWLRAYFRGKRARSLAAARPHI